MDTAQLTNGYFWAPKPDKEHPVEIAKTPDLTNKKLIKLVSYLAPSRFRIGGTACQGIYFCPEEGNCTMPENYKNTYKSPNNIPTTLVHEKI